ncbi:DUF3238 domain-containing protein [Bacillus mycoides]|uniref:DUF3238 domain-containing protein n=1 Tax=Bacillus mycoides TaxID=1405 RepID=UPI001C035D5D|nr:DUF3238 domain-containing protein [Bacillus mycoides]QWG33345.1 DUF3238 domain-containing protein [Bacillus mycoides]
MFKKIFSALLLFFLAVTSFIKVSFADETIVKEPLDKWFFAYNEPSFTAEKSNGGQQFGPQKSLAIKEKRANGWWKVVTFEGDKWINTTGEQKKIEKPYITFAEPKFTSPKGNNGNAISPQIVTVIDGQEDGWLKIQTNEGDKWIFPDSEAVKVDKSFYAYNEPSFTSKKGQEFGPQKTLVVKEKRTNGWWKIATYEGDKWINLTGEQKKIEKPYITFAEPKFSSPKGNSGNPISPQVVTVIDGQEDGWLKIQTNEGDKWIFPNSEAVKVDKSFYVYNEPSFTSEKGQEFGPQKTLVVKEKRTNGWWKVATYEGDKWVALDGELKKFDSPFYVYYEPNFASQKGNMEIPYNPTTIKVVDGNTNGWLKVQTWEGDKWMYPGLIESVAVNKNFYVYNEPSFTATKGNNGQQYGPQKALGVIEKLPNGWWKVVTYEGPKWVALNGEERNMTEQFATFNQPSFDSGVANDFTFYEPQKILILDGQADGWLKIKTWEGEKWINLEGEKMCKRFKATPKFYATRTVSETENEFSKKTDDIKIENQSNSITLSWNKRDGLNYKIEKLNEEDKWEYVWSGENSHYTVGNLDSGISYTFKFISYKGNEEEKNESIITASTLRDNNTQQQYASKVGITRASADNVNGVVYPMQNAFINSVKSGEFNKVSWGNIPNDTGLYEVYKDGNLVGTTTKTEFTDKMSTMYSQPIQKAAGNFSQKVYYDIKTVKQLPQQVISEREQKLKDAGITLNESQKEEIKCEVKNASTYIEKDYAFSSRAENVAASSIQRASGSYSAGYKFRYQTFIPYKSVEAPWQVKAAYKSFHGDGRGFAYDTNKFRTRLDVTVMWQHDQTKWLNIMPTINAEPDTGITRGVPQLGILPKEGQAPKSDMQMSLHSKSYGNVQFGMRTASANPLVPGAPDIDAYAFVTLNRNGSGATAGYHDQAPSHEFYKILHTPYAPDINPATLHKRSISDSLGFDALWPWKPKVEFVNAFPAEWAWD